MVVVLYFDNICMLYYIIEVGDNILLNYDMKVYIIMLDKMMYK